MLLNKKIQIGLFREVRNKYWKAKSKKNDDENKKKKIAFRVLSWKMKI